MSWGKEFVELIKSKHDRSFEIIMRTIIQTYPYLADECRKQLNAQGIGIIDGY